MFFPWIYIPPAKIGKGYYENPHDGVLIGEGATIGAGFVVLIDLPAGTTAVGNPARLLVRKEKPSRHENVAGESMDHTSFISEWSDLII
ncbi:hypothetical protein MKW92_025531 [Papaver armeniacum]|nr:hypothetical protein MKW92_025531 [Papaver armeniacum]